MPRLANPSSPRNIALRAWHGIKQTKAHQRAGVPISRSAKKSSVHVKNALRRIPKQRREGVWYATQAVLRQIGHDYQFVRSSIPNLPQGKAHTFSFLNRVRSQMSPELAKRWGTDRESRIWGYAVDEEMQTRFYASKGKKPYFRSKKEIAEVIAIHLQQIRSIVNKWVFSFPLSISREEVLQIVVEKLSKKLRKYDPQKGKSIDSYIGGGVRYTLYDFSKSSVRRHKRERFVSLDRMIERGNEPISNGSPSQRMSRDLRRYYSLRIGRIENKYQRWILRRNLLDGKTVLEIAKERNVTRQAIQVHHQRGLKALREILASEPE